MKGIDVSENNGNVDWEAVARAGYEFAIIRLGYGHGHLDSKFYNNINAAKAVGLKLGVYYYSYAVTEDDAEYEADYIAKILDDCGLGANDLPMGVWIDEEDADGWRERHGLDMSPEGLQTITNMVTLTVNKLWDAGLQPAGVYCNLDWLENHIDMSQTGGAGLWIAHPDAEDAEVSCMLWQYTFDADINGRKFDANVTGDGWDE